MSDTELSWFVDLVVTEDSDLIAYGAQAVLFKLSEESSSGLLFFRSDLQFTQKYFSLIDFSDAMIATMFVAAGCDYCPSLPGIGIKTARDIVHTAFHSLPSNIHSTSNFIPPLQIVFASIYAKTTKKSTLSMQDKSHYETSFLSALLIYRNSIVFDLHHFKSTYTNNQDKELCCYKPYQDLWNDSSTQQQILGALHDAQTSVAIAQGIICPRTHAPYSQDPYLIQLPFLFPSNPNAVNNFSPNNNADSKENTLPSSSQPNASKTVHVDIDSRSVGSEDEPSTANSAYTTISF